MNACSSSSDPVIQKSGQSPRSDTPRRDRKSNTLAWVLKLQDQSKVMTVFADNFAWLIFFRHIIEQTASTIHSSVVYVEKIR